MLEFPSRFEGAPPGARARVSLGYLSSYEHMGRALLFCAGACECEEALVDAHREGGSVSVDAFATVEARPRPRPPQRAPPPLRVWVRRPGEGARGLRR